MPPLHPVSHLAPLIWHYGWTVEPLLIPLYGSVTEDETRRSISSNCSSGSEILCRGATRDLILDPPLLRLRCQADMDIEGI